MNFLIHWGKMAITKAYRLFFVLCITVLLTGCSMLPNWLGEREEEALSGNRLNVLPSETTVKPDLEGATTSVSAESDKLHWIQAISSSTDMGNFKLESKFDSIDYASIGSGNDWQTPLNVSPVASETTIYAMDSKGFVSAHKISDVDSKIWQTSISKAARKSNIPGGGLAIGAENLYAITGSGEFASISLADGKVAFSRSLNLPVRSAPRFYDGKIFVTTLDNQLIAIDALDGKILWKHSGVSEATGILGAATPVAESGVVVATYSSGEVFAIDTNSGKEAWAESLATTSRISKTASLSDIDASPVIDSGNVYISGHGGALASYNLSSGRQIWERDIPSISTPWIDGNYIYVLTTQNELLALDKNNGSIIWVLALPKYKNEEKMKDAVSISSPIMAGGRLLLAGNRGEMYIVSADNGNLIRKIKIPEEVYTQPIIVSGKIFLVTKKAEIAIIN